MGYSPSQARNYNGGQTQPTAGTYNTQTPPEIQQFIRPPAPAAPAPTPAAPAPTPFQPMRAPPAPAQVAPPAPAAVRAAAPAPQAPLVFEKMESEADHYAPWSVQGLQEPYGITIQGDSIVFTRAGVYLFYVSVQKAPTDCMLKLFNPLTQQQIFFSYGNDECAFLSLTKSVDANEAWRLHVVAPTSDQGAAPVRVQASLTKLN